jgi:FAD dependent oxidoreductase
MVTEGLRHWFSPSSAFYVNPRSLVSLLPFLVSFSRHANQRAYLSAFRKLDELNRLTAELFDELAAGEFLDRSALRKLEPSLGEAACWGFLRPEVRWGDPSIFVDQLSGHLKKRGVAVDEPFSVDAITDRPGSVVVSSSDGDEREYDSVLIAAGTRSRELVRGLGQRIALVPGRGYSFTCCRSGCPATRCCSVRPMSARRRWTARAFASPAPWSSVRPPGCRDGGRPTGTEGWAGVARTPGGSRPSRAPRAIDDAALKSFAPGR